MRKKITKEEYDKLSKKDKGIMGAQVETWKPLDGKGNVIEDRVRVSYYITAEKEEKPKKKRTIKKPENVSTAKRSKVKEAVKKVMGKGKE
jgi:endo-1,4-beta-D-glucanase Y|tara:strand:- start:101 stop:370 length:270 start_codon:yes stop_codon:yes gene_type:complete